MCPATDGHFRRSLYIIVFLACRSAVNCDDYDLLSLSSLSINASCHDDVTCCRSYTGAIGSTSFSYRIVVIVHLVQAVSLHRNLVVSTGTVIVAILLISGIQPNPDPTCNVNQGRVNIGSLNVRSAVNKADVIQSLIADHNWICWLYRRLG